VQVVVFSCLHRHLREAVDRLTVSILELRFGFSDVT
jgi:hypothetical protein